MQGLMLKFFEHSVLAPAESDIELPPASSAGGLTRYNLTCRYIVNHTARCQGIAKAGKSWQSRTHH